MSLYKENSKNTLKNITITFYSGHRVIYDFCLTLTIFNNQFRLNISIVRRRDQNKFKHSYSK